MKLAFFLLTALSLPFISRPLEVSSSYSSSGDGFHLREESFETTQSFVYTAKAHFESGQAGGLVFGAEENKKAFVFNVDRKENCAKLLYFASEEGKMKATELYNEPFIGNDKTSESEFAMIRAPLSNLPDFYFKVVLTAEENKVYGEFYLDNIKRFGVDSKIELTSLGYEGGRIGFNTFASEISFDDITIGKSAYSYYSEPYRNQYHYSQFAHWNNDPNGLVYYQGYYHLYYQLNPYGKTWGDMYWGHARSKDLLHWQELPIALFPDNGTLGFGNGNGYAWSGSAFVYHKGMSKAVDDKNWFPNGNGDGLLFAYTRDGSSSQDQIILSSDDGGMTFTRRVFIPQSLYKEGAKKDCRDPKIITLGKNDFLMIVSSLADNRVIFFRSSDLLSWSSCGGFNYPRPECVDVLNVTADNGEKKQILTFMGREYIVGEFKVQGDRVLFVNQDGIDLSTLEMSSGAPMDYARDRYATQSFVIDDIASPYYGKAISVSWWSAVPGEIDAIESGSLAAFRSSWNGGGQTIPTEEKLLYENGRYVLSESPITYENASLSKRNVVKDTFELDNSSANPLENVASSCLEINASFTLEKNTALEFHVSESEEEWVGIGYNKERGYYVDRTHSNEQASTLRAYNRIYQTGPLENKNEIDFKILVDHGGVEVYADKGKYPFYVLTVSLPTSFGASLSVQGKAIGQIEANEIESTFITPVAGEGMLYVNELETTLDMNLTTSRTILAYDSANCPITYKILEGEGIIRVVSVNGGVKVEAIAPGQATLEISTPTMAKQVQITVYGTLNDKGDISFESSGIHAGRWNETPDGIIGNCPNGDGYLLSSTTLEDFIYSASFSIEGAAVGLIFRASQSLDDYVIANVDKASHVTKLFSKRNGVIAEVSLGEIDLSQVTLTVEVQGDNVKVLVNGILKIESVLPNNELTSGYLGLNVFSGQATFSSPRLLPSSYSYSGGQLSVKLPSESKALRLTNLTNKNSLISQELYTTDGSTLVLKEEIFAPLKANSTYQFKADTTKGALSFKVDIQNYSYELKLQDLTLNEGLSYRAKLYGKEVTSLTVNGKECSYKIENDVLVIAPTSFHVGNNEVVLNGSARATVLVIAKSNANPSSLKSLSLPLIEEESQVTIVTLLLLGLTSLLLAYKSHKARKD